MTSLPSFFMCRNMLLMNIFIISLGVVEVHFVVCRYQYRYQHTHTFSSIGCSIKPWGALGGHSARSWLTGGPNSGLQLAGLAGGGFGGCGGAAAQAHPGVGGAAARLRQCAIPMALLAAPAHT